MNKYALLALDMDGTLLNDEHSVSKATAQAIQAARNNGVTVILSTGRAFKNAVKYAEELDLTGPHITVNGSEIWKDRNELYVRHLLDQDKIRKMYELSQKYDTWFWAYSTNQLYNRHNWDADIDAEQWLKFGYDTEDDEIRGHILTELRMMGGLELTNSSPHNIEINPEGINKASGLRTVCKMLGYEMSQVVAVGDSLNDIAAIQAAGLGIAMGNAQEKVKLAADAVVATNNNDGIAEAIHRFLL